MIDSFRSVYSANKIQINREIQLFLFMAFLFSKRWLIFFKIVVGLFRTPVLPSKLNVNQSREFLGLASRHHS